MSSRLGRWAHHAVDAPPTQTTTHRWWRCCPTRAPRSSGSPPPPAPPATRSVCDVYAPTSLPYIRNDNPFHTSHIFTPTAQQTTLTGNPRPDAPGPKGGAPRGGHRQGAGHLPELHQRALRGEVHAGAPQEAQHRGQGMCVCWGGRGGGMRVAWVGFGWGWGRQYSPRLIRLSIELKPNRTPPAPRTAASAPGSCTRATSTSRCVALMVPHTQPAGRMPPPQSIHFNE